MVRIWEASKFVSGGEEERGRELTWPPDLGKESRKSLGHLGCWSKPWLLHTVNSATALALGEGRLGSRAGLPGRKPVVPRWP